MRVGRKKRKEGGVRINERKEGRKQLFMIS